MHPEGESPSGGRYGQYETDDGSIVLFDDENDDAWIASDEAEPILWQT